MSRDPYCPRCGVVENIHSGVYCSRLSESEKLNATLREAIYGLRAELREARAVIRNTAETVQAFREQAEKLREQRDRAVKAANRIADLDDEGWDCNIEIIRELADEISKEKEGK
jgi:uncharacterized protein (UPF0147 family)